MDLGQSSAHHFFLDRGGRVAHLQPRIHGTLLPARPTRFVQEFVILKRPSGAAFSFLPPQKTAFRRGWRRRRLVLGVPHDGLARRLGPCPRRQFGLP